MIVRPSRPLHSQSRLFNRSRRAALVAVSVASVLLGTSISFDVTAQESAASAPPVTASDATAVVASAPTHYSVKPGQSLSDIASQITGSSDRATREKMARALFDANPNAFMGHDPSRLKLGAVLNVPPIEDAGTNAASAASVASTASASAGAALSSAPVASPEPAVAASAAETAVAPAEGASSAVGVATGAAASGAVTSNASSEANPAAASSEAQPAASATESASLPALASASVSAAASAPAASIAPSATSAGSTSGSGPIGWIIGAVAAIGLLLMAMRAGKRRRAAAAIGNDDSGTSDTPVAPATPEPHDSSMHHAHLRSRSATGAADLEGASVQRDQSELNGVAASLEHYDAAQSFDTPADDASRTPVEPHSFDDDGAAGAQVTSSAIEGRGEGGDAADAAAGTGDTDAKRAPFMPDAPAALHRDFTPPRPGTIEAALAAERAAAERAAAARAEFEAREQEEREVAAAELAAREAAARAAVAREEEERKAAEQELAAREAAAREAEAREVAAREAAAREAEAREVAAREAAERETEARETALRNASGQDTATHPSQAQESASREYEESEHPGDRSSYDDEPSPASRFPQPKFPQDAIDALSTLDFGLPPRHETPKDTPPQPALPGLPSSGQLSPAPTESAELSGRVESESAAPVSPAITPQPIADPAVFDHQNAQHRHPEAAASSESASEQIKSGTAGAASVAGLGASRFGPLSLDFDYHSPASQTEPLPAFTPEQISTIARNKLELAVEYIELGDLSGARTLLQEVIESNDPATRQPAATLLSTLAPLS
jgi:pilus assembly protein FimV